LISNKETLLKAREYAFLLLKFRLRSEKELYQRLKQKKFSEEVIRDTIEFLKEKKFLDDGLFAKGWINSRIKKPYGLRRIVQELKLKGIDKEIIEEKLGEAKKNYQEEEVVEELIEERLNKLKNIEPQTARKRVYGYLARRGFSPEIIIDKINILCKQTY